MTGVAILFGIKGEIQIANVEYSGFVHLKSIHGSTPL